MISGIWILLKLYLSNHKQHQNCEIELICNDLMKIISDYDFQVAGFSPKPQSPQSMSSSMMGWLWQSDYHCTSDLGWSEPIGILDL